MKTLSLPLLSTWFGLLAAPAHADVAMSLSSQKSYRQNQSNVNFLGGSFDISLRDGLIIYEAGCARSAFWPANVPLDPCQLGATGYVIFGQIGGLGGSGINYFSVTSIIPAIIIEPRRSDLCILAAAPASTLPRPSGGFSDSSVGSYFNIQTTSVRENVVTNYSQSRTYGPSQRSKFESEIVPGVYHYAFPRLGSPNLISGITAVIYPMPEGLQKLNNQESGFTFTTVNDKKPIWTSDGFVQLSFSKPNVINWKGFSPSIVIPSTDSLFLSVRAMANPNDPTSNLTGESLFPAFISGQDQRVLLPHPFITSYTTPPIFPSGTKGILELELERNLQTGGITYDHSTRQFQIPIKVVDSYADYAETNFSSRQANIGILEDADKDGYNNLTEWILDSSPTNSGSIPVSPTPGFYTAAPFDPFTGVGTSYFGFLVNEKVGTQPGVDYTLQRSTDNGKTWTKFTSDADWSVFKVYSPLGITPRSVAIQVASTTGFQPKGTLKDLYRVKITLK